MAKTIRLFFAAVCLTSASWAFDNGEYNFQRVRAGHETLKHSTLSIVQDPYGFMWFGTLQGLIKYDGHNFTPYRNDLEDVNSISQNTIRSLKLDHSNNLLIGTQGAGLNKMNLKTGKIDHFDQFPELKTADIWSIDIDKSGNIWAATYNQGIHFLEKKSNQLYTFRHSLKKGNSLPTDNTRKVFIDNKQRVWVGTSEGVCRYEPERQEFLRIVDHKTKKPFKSMSRDICQTSDGTLWAATYDGLLKINAETLSGELIRFESKTVEENEAIFQLSIIATPENRLWIGTSQGLIIYDIATGTHKRLKHLNVDPYTLKHNYIVSLFQGEDDIIWVGTDKGVDKFTGANYFHSIELENSIIRGVFEVPGKGVCVANAVEPNLYKLVDHHLELIPSSAKLLEYRDDNYVTSIEQVGNKLWVGTWRTGIKVTDLDFNEEKIIHFHFQLGPESSSNQIQKILKASSGQLWVGTENGLMRYDPSDDAWMAYKGSGAKKRLSDDRVQSNALKEDKEGNIWVGTWNGLNKIDHSTNEVTQWKLEDGLNNAQILSLHFDKDGYLWIGTYGGGLMKYNPHENTFDHYDHIYSIKNNIVFAIQQDKSGFLWLSTPNGIIRFDKSEEIASHFDIDDGLRNYQFYFGLSLKDQNGKIYFGGYDGLVCFSPNEIKMKQLEPKVSITNFKIFNEEIKYPKFTAFIDTFEVSHEQYLLQFDFTAFDYFSPTKTAYRYKLEGLNDNWVDAGHNRTAIFTNLSGGNYNLQIQAQDVEGRWESDVKSVLIIVHPPFYNIWWVRLVFIVLLIFSLYLWYKWRIKRIETQRQILAVKVKESTQEVSRQKEEIEESRQIIKQQNRDLMKVNVQLEETVRKRTEHLQKANNELDRFVYSASHDLSSPLKSIEGLLNLAQYENNSDNVQQIHHMMSKSIQKLQYVINELLNFSRNLGKDIEFKTFQFHRLVTELYQDLRFDKDFEKVKFIKEYDASLELCTDSFRLKAILQNLVSNSIKYADFEKEESWVRVKYYETDKSHCIIVEDNGIGISENDQNKVFDMFYRATEMSEGSGLGLYIVKEMATKLKAKVQLVSKLGEGSSFTIEIEKVQDI